ncbi:MAG: glycosyltransferase [Planctomycetes bacterium]|nr:glycosyltransferase [Planctomycetota bacterium]
MAQKVLHLITELYPGGAERIVLDLCSAMDRDEFMPLVAALDGRGEYADLLRERGIEVIDLGAYSRCDLGVIWRLRKILREWSIDIVHAHLIHSSVVGRLAARPLAIPVVSTSHIVDRRGVWWHFLLDRLTARWCAAEICVSKAVKNFLIEKTGLEEKLFNVIYNGLDFSRFDKVKPKAEARKELGLPGDEMLVGVLGRFDAQKGIDIFIRAASVLAKSGECENLHFVVAGYGEKEGELKNLARVAGLGESLTFVGYRQAQDFFPALDIAVCPSRWEGFGLVVLEAMYCGLPVIASEIDSLPEIINNGEDGILVAPENPQALADCIAGLAKDGGLRAKFSSKARDRAKDFSLEKMVNGYRSVYQSLLVGENITA